MLPINLSTSFLALMAAGHVAAQDIQVTELGALDPMEVGVATNGLGDSLWRGSSLQTALNALEALPSSSSQGYTSPARANLVSLVLLSGGQPPEGARGNEALALLRADRLLASAGAEATFSLLERTPGLDEAPDLARLHAETAFALAAGEAGCRTANGLIEGRNQAYWLRARAFCHALNGEDAAAELSADLARSQSPDDNFDGLLYAITLGRWTIDQLSADTGLDWALAAVAPAEGRPAVDLSDAPEWLVNTAERAAAQTELGGDPAIAFEGLSNLPAADRDDLLAQLIVQNYDRVTAGRALGLYLADADAAGRFMQVAREYGRQIDTLPVSVETIAYGYHFALAALSVGDLANARRWQRALEDGPPRPRPQPLPVDPGKQNDVQGASLPGERDQLEWQPPQPRLMVGLELAIRVAQNNLRQESTEALIAARLEAGEPGVGDVAALAGLGFDVPSDLRLALMNLDSRTVSPVLASMEAASLAGARAETALLVAQLLEAGPANASAYEMMRVTASLDRVGLRDMAMALLLERLIVDLS